MKTELVISALAIFLVSCTPKNEVTDTTGNQGKNGLANVPTIKVSDAQSIMISSQDTAYVVTTSNKVRKLAFTDADTVVSPEFAYLHVRNVVPLNDNYIYMNGDFWYKNASGEKVEYHNILVRESDGAIFDFGTYYNVTTRLGDKPVKKDGNGNIYFGEISKLSLSDPNNLVIEYFLPTGETARFFEVDADGNCLYNYGEGNGVTHSNGTENYRLRKVNGGIAEISVEGRDNKEVWVGNNGMLYMVTYTWSNGYEPIIHTIINNNGTVAINNVWYPSSKDEMNAVGQMFRSAGQGSILIRKTNSIVFVDTYFSWTKSFEFFEETNTVMLLDLPHFEQGCKYTYNETYYYIASGNNLYRIRLDNHTYENLFDSNTYSVYSLNALANGVLEVSALRFSDGKKVLLHIDSDKSITTIDETSNYEARSLVRIN